MNINFFKTYFRKQKENFSFELISADEKRIPYIDFIRGLAALSVIFIHTVWWSGENYVPLFLRNLSLLFDVPVFFLCTGIAMGLKKDHLISIPGAAFRLVTAFSLLIFLTDLFSGNWSFSNTFASLFLSVKSNPSPLITGSYWFVIPFLSTLFFSEIIILFFNRYIPFIIGIFLFYYLFVQIGVLPGNYLFQSKLCFIAFMLLGYWFIVKGIDKAPEKKELTLGILGLLIVIFLITAFVQQGLAEALNLQANKFPVKLSYMAFSLLSLGVILLFYSPKRKCPKCICKIGENAVWFYAAQCIGATVLLSLAPAIKCGWVLKLLLNFSCNLLVTLVTVWVLKSLYSLLVFFSVFSAPVKKENGCVQNK